MRVQVEQEPTLVVENQDGASHSTRSAVALGGQRLAKLVDRVPQQRPPLQQLQATPL